MLFLGRDDVVQCYHCGVALRMWNPEERPWEEHAKWRPDCAFLQLVKGKKFVDQIQQRWGKRKRKMMEESKPEELNTENVTLFLLHSNKP